MEMNQWMNHFSWKTIWLWVAWVWNGGGNCMSCCWVTECSSFLSVVAQNQHSASLPLAHCIWRFRSDRVCSNENLSKSSQNSLLSSCWGTNNAEDAIEMINYLLLDLGGSSSFSFTHFARLLSFCFDVLSCLGLGPSPTLSLYLFLFVWCFDADDPDIGWGGRRRTGRWK